VTKRLIVNADDLGMSKGVNRGILEGHQCGLITSTSVMTNMPQAEAGIRTAMSQAPDLGLGLHVTLTWGRPVLPTGDVPSLVSAQGAFRDIFQFLASPSDAGHVRAEITAQYERFCEIAGQVPDHLDAHQFAANLVPEAFAVLLELATQHGLPIRNPAPFVDARIMRELAEGVGGVRLDERAFAALRRCIEPNRQLLAQEACLRWPDYFEYHFYGPQSTRRTLVEILKSLPEGTTELMCHPGYILDPDDGYGATREAELALLMDPAIRAIVETESIQLVTFAQV
jgi:predicted glycoside hydrolase/deacetylase ChbG (UPF0249 family)